jgi:hypothetical protein
MITLKNKYEKLADSIFKFKNDINPDEWISVIEKVSSTSYPFSKVDRRPHMTMELPTLYSKSDDISAINLRSAFFEKIMPAISIYMQENNISNMFPKKTFITVSKLNPGSPMSLHKDNQDQKSNHLIAMMYINDNFNGGELHIVKEGIKYKPKAGDIVIYKGNMEHEVLECDAPRYSIGYGLTDIL